MNYDLEMKVRFCSKHKKLFDSSFVKVGRTPCIEVNAFCKAWKQAKMCPQCRWKTAWGEDLKEKHYKPIKWPINHEGCIEAPKPLGPEPKTPEPNDEWKPDKSQIRTMDEEEETEEEYSPETSAERAIVEKGCRFPRCWGCNKVIDTVIETYLFSRPCIFFKRYRCYKCGKQHEALPLEFGETWKNTYILKRS